MDITRLLSDELSYELAIRGAPPTGSVAEKRQRLRGLMRLEKLGNTSLSAVTDLDCQTELNICILKLDELQAAADRFEFNNASNEKSRIQSRLLHIMGRLNRIVSPDFANVKGELLLRCGHISDFLEEAMALVERGEPVTVANQHSLLDEPNELLPELVEQNNLAESEEAPLIDLVEGITSRQNMATTGFQGTSRMASSVQHQSMEDLKRRYGTGDTSIRGNINSACLRNTLANSTFNQERPVERRVSFADGTSGPNLNCISQTESEDRARVYRIISQWDIRLEGSSEVEAFIERVEELRVACGLSNVQLMGSLITLFKGPALQWYRANVQSHHTWDHVTHMLRAAFLPADYTDDLWEVINKRKQQPRERTVMFIAAMQNLFNKLDRKPSEASRIKKIRKNLLPHIKDRLILEDFDTVGQLTQACQRIENAQVCTPSMRVGTSNQASDQNFAYHNRRPAIYSVDTNVSEINSGISNTPTFGTMASAGMSRPVKCFNCHQPGHINRDCTKPFRLHCYKCGKVNVTVRTCPVCSGNSTPAHN